MAERTPKDLVHAVPQPRTGILHPVSFVMNDPQEIEVAWRDYRAGRMGHLTSSR